MDVNLVTWEALGKFSIAALVDKYKNHAPVAWHLTECMAASRKNGVVVVKKQRPHPIVRILMESNILTSLTFSYRFKWELSARQRERSHDSSSNAMNHGEPVQDQMENG